MEYWEEQEQEQECSRQEGHYCLRQEEHHCFGQVRGEQGGQGREQRGKSSFRSKFIRVLCERGRRRSVAYEYLKMKATGERRRRRRRGVSGQVRVGVVDGGEEDGKVFGRVWSRLLLWARTRETPRPHTGSRSYIAYAGRCAGCPMSSDSDSISDLDSAKARSLALLYRLTPIITTAGPTQQQAVPLRHSTTHPIPYHFSYRITSYGIWRTYVPLFVTISQAPIPPTYVSRPPSSIPSIPRLPPKNPKPPSHPG